MTKTISCILCIGSFCLLGCGPEKIETPEQKLNRSVEKKDAGIDGLKACHLQMQVLEQAVKSYYLHMGERPQTLKDLIESPPGSVPKRWKGPYVENVRASIDPWGNEFELGYGKSEENPRRFIVVLKSSGPDGKQGTGDDISNLDKSSDN